MFKENLDEFDASRWVIYQSFSLYPSKDDGNLDWNIGLLKTRFAHKIQWGLVEWISKVYNSDKLNFTEDYMRFGRFIPFLNRVR